MTASGNGITLRARVSALLRHSLRFTGSLASPTPGRTIVVQRLDPQAGWVAVASATSRSDGSFTAVWQTDRIGRFTIRATTDASGTAARAAADAATLNVTVYRPAIATTYGEGSYGEQTACGQVLTSHMLGVAHRSLKCGTPVAIYYAGRTIVVPVIDRGPYANNADWDLTEATSKALKVDGTARIGAIALRSEGQASGSRSTRSKR
jgi:rare lipoprotein A (peptidoglycan hydrolase)